MSTLHEKIGMRIGLTLTNSTIPSKGQVNEFLREGLHRVTDLLMPNDLWPLTKSKVMSYPDEGISLDDLKDSSSNIEGFAQIISVFRWSNTDKEYVRCIEVLSTDYRKAAGDTHSMLYGKVGSPVFTYRNGKIVVLPKPDNSSVESNDAVEVNYLSSITIDSSQESIPNVSPHVESVVTNYATSQAADVLAAYYAQDDDPMAQKIAILSQTQMKAFQMGIETLNRKKKFRGHIS